MLPENRIATHPGVILQDQFLEPLGPTQVALAEHLRRYDDRTLETP